MTGGSRSSTRASAEHRREPCAEFESTSTARRHFANYADGLSDVPISGATSYPSKRVAPPRVSSVSRRRTPSISCIPTRKTTSTSSVVASSPVRINGGFFVLRKDIFDYMQPGEELVVEPFQRLMKNGSFSRFHMTASGAIWTPSRNKIQLDVDGDARAERRGRCGNARGAPERTVSCSSSRFAAARIERTLIPDRSAMSSNVCWSSDKFSTQRARRRLGCWFRRERDTGRAGRAAARRPARGSDSAHCRRASRRRNRSTHNDSAICSGDTKDRVVTRRVVLGRNCLPAPHERADGHAKARRIVPPLVEPYGKKSMTWWGRPLC